jgi:hypothetical protein
VLVPATVAFRSVASAVKFLRGLGGLWGWRKSCQFSVVRSQLSVRSCQVRLSYRLRSHCYLSESRFRAKILESTEYKIPKPKRLSLARRRRDRQGEEGTALVQIGGSRTEPRSHEVWEVFFLFFFVPLCEHIFWLRPEAALGPVWLPPLSGLGVDFDEAGAGFYNPPIP